MKREIKFRAWDTEEKEMFLPETENNSDSYFTGFDLGKLQCRDLESENPDERYILMQYTGLKDRNGKEIYEGDILKWGNTSSFVVWSLDGWRFNSYMEKGTLALYPYLDTTTGQDRAEITGNIYEHPNLLVKERTK